jgi:hypothetical protein
MGTLPTKGNGSCGTSGYVGTLLTKGHSTCGYVGTLLTKGNGTCVTCGYAGTHYLRYLQVVTFGKLT